MNSSSQNKGNQQSHMCSQEDSLRLVRAFDPMQEDSQQVVFFEEQCQDADAEEEVPDSLGIEDDLFQETGEAELLEKMDISEAFRPEMNPISGATLAKLIQEKSHPYIIIDCRWDYEYQVGHI